MYGFGSFIFPETANSAIDVNEMSKESPISYGFEVGYTVHDENNHREWEIPIDMKTMFPITSEAMIVVYAHLSARDNDVGENTLRADWNKRVLTMPVKDIIRKHTDDAKTDKRYCKNITEYVVARVSDVKNFGVKIRLESETQQYYDTWRLKLWFAAHVVRK